MRPARLCEKGLFPAVRRDSEQRSRAPARLNAHADLRGRRQARGRRKYPRVNTAICSGGISGLSGGSIGKIALDTWYSA